MSKSFFTGTDAELYAGSTNFSLIISGAPSTYGLTPPQATMYAAMNTMWTAAYETAINPQTRTRSNIAAKNAARVQIVTLASNYAKIIDGTPTVTDAQ
ncbi:MAG: hypothetical protein IT447_08175, partial [Phycisphaerales bacterium]|nr:hypothetical protein [Phycisphaerales bacterium]